jgi:hypothetical protein
MPANLSASLIVCELKQTKMEMISQKLYSLYLSYVCDVVWWGRECLLLC